MSDLKSTEVRNWVLDAKKEKPWYAKPLTAIIGLIILAIIDIGGFIEGVFNHLIGQFILPDPTSDDIMPIVSCFIMVLGFFVAFEVATLYMAYAFSLKLYGYDRSALKVARKTEEVRRKERGDATIVINDDKRFEISKFISTTALGWFAFFAFILGVIANVIFRVGIMAENQYLNNEEYFEFALNIVLIILPIVTSILNFVIGCFTFDPLLFEMNNLSKSIEDYEKKIGNINVNVEFCNNELSRIDDRKTKDEELMRKSIEHLSKCEALWRNEMYNAVLSHLKK